MNVAQTAIQKLCYSFWIKAVALVCLAPALVYSGDVVAPGWERSYKAGAVDTNGQFMGGSELMHIVGHNGKLFASNGYWEDSTNIWYGGTNPNTGWAQVLRLDNPGGQWQVDLQMGPQYLRAEALQSITFNTDANGVPLNNPVNLLVASAEAPISGGTTVVSVFTRCDAAGNWATNTFNTGPTPANAGDRSVRAICMHRDKVTGIDRIFISIGKLGIFSGVYASAAAGQIQWNTTSESGPVSMRILAIVEADSNLLFSSGQQIYRRNDGVTPSYTVVEDMSDLYPVVTNQDIGGIRGLTAIPNPSGKGQSLLFAMEDGSTSLGPIYRLDPQQDGSYKRVLEVQVADLMSKYLAGDPVYFILAAYNNFYPVVDPDTQDTVWLVGFESWIGGHSYPLFLPNSNGGYYAGGMYAIRDKYGSYRTKEINGRCTTSTPTLVSTRDFASSPFSGQAGNAIYFGGYDANQTLCTNMAWIFSTLLTNALQSDVPMFKTQPTNSSVMFGQPVSFTPVVSGNSPLAFQWTLNGTNLVNATNMTYAIAAAAFSDAGVYALRASNSLGVATSSNATLATLSGPCLLSITSSGNGCSSLGTGPYVSATLSSGANTQIVYTAAEWNRISALASNGVPLITAVGARFFTQSVANISANISNAVAFALATPTQTGYTNVPTSWMTNWTEEAIHAAQGRDGFSVHDKYILGLDPTSSNSYRLVIEGCSPSGSNVVIVVRRDVSGLLASNGMGGSLILQATPSMANAFTNLPAAILTGPNMFDATGHRSYTNTVDHANKYYKVIVQ